MVSQLQTNYIRLHRVPLVFYERDPPQRVFNLFSSCRSVRGYTVHETGSGYLLSLTLFDEGSVSATRSTLPQHTEEEEESSLDQRQRSNRQERQEKLTKHDNIPLSNDLVTVIPNNTSSKTKGL